MIYRVGFLFAIFFAIAWGLLFLAFATNYYSKERVKRYARNLLISTGALVFALGLIGVLSSFDNLI